MGVIDSLYYVPLATHCLGASLNCQYCADGLIILPERGENAANDVALVSAGPLTECTAKILEERQRVENVLQDNFAQKVREMLYYT